MISFTMPDGCHMELHDNGELWGRRTCDKGADCAPVKVEDAGWQGNPVAAALLDRCSPRKILRVVRDRGLRESTAHLARLYLINHICGDTHEEALERCAEQCRDSEGEIDHDAMRELNEVIQVFATEHDSPEAEIEF